jgi:hypothetical protein
VSATVAEVMVARLNMWGQDEELADPDKTNLLGGMWAVIAAVFVNRSGYRRSGEFGLAASRQVLAARGPITRHGRGAWRALL